MEPTEVMLEGRIESLGLDLLLILMSPKDPQRVSNCDNVMSQIVTPAVS